jgi:DNA-binding beta-propeller fold protein YncE
LPKETNAPIVIVDPGDATRLQKDLGDRYTAKRFAVRGWWQIEWDKMTASNLLRFLIFRRVWNPTGTTDAVLLVAKDLAAQKVLPTVALHAPAPVRDYSGTGTRANGRVIGQRGAGPGQFSEPRALAFGGDGNVLVADTENNRIQKLAPDGTVLGVWGGPGAGDGPGQFRQPCGVTAAADGSIYVADTWNHRIQKLDAQGHFILQWREEEPSFWGPRSVVAAPNGAIFVADTGNKRVIAYDPGGQKLLSFGGEGSEPGKFVEPVGLAVDPQSQVLYVADTGNHRVQSFDLQGKFRNVWTVFGWQEFYTEPYLVWHSGTLWATDSFNHRVNAYDASGTLKKSIDGASGAVTLGRPTGIAVAPDGRVFVADLTAGHLVVLDAGN